jgi:hypothetical protein
MKRKKNLFIFFSILLFVNGSLFSQTAITTFTHHANTAHHTSEKDQYDTNGGSTPQYVHSSTQIVYLAPGTNKTLSAVTKDMTYYRWYRSNTPFNKGQTDGVADATLLTSTTNTNRYNGTQGIIYSVAKATIPANVNQGEALNTTGQSITVIPPSNLNTNYPQYVTCDVSNFTDFSYNAGSSTFTEPTLSFRNHFELRPAWEIARAIDKALLLNTASGTQGDKNHAYEVIRLTAPVGGTGTNTGANMRDFTHLKLSTKFYASNYYYKNSTTLDNNITASTSVIQGVRLYWVCSTDSTVNGNIYRSGTIAGVTGTETGTNAASNANSIYASGNYSFPSNTSINSDHHILEIVTGGSGSNRKIAGTVEYYDVYISNSTTNPANAKKVARFIVTYVNRDAATTTGPVKVPFGTGPRVPTTMVGSEGHVADIMNVVQNKKEIAYLSFDQPESNLFNMGSVPLPLDESSYGFDDPHHFEPDGSGSISINQNYPAGTHHRSASAYYSEYSFPKAVRGGITGAYNGGRGFAWSSGVTGNPYSWWSTAGISIYDRTYINNGGQQYANSPTPSNTLLGNFMYVDAADSPGTLATLSINEAMCPGTELYFSAWMMNVNGNSAEYGKDTRPDLTFILKDGSNNEITRFYTGDFGRAVANGVDSHKWYEVAFNFTVPEEYADPDHATKFVLEIVNNGLSTNGNDFALDEIKIWRKNPSVSAVRTNIEFCRPEAINMGEPLDIRVDINITNLVKAGEVIPTEIFLTFKDAQGTYFPLNTYQSQRFYDEYNFAYSYFDLKNLPTTPQPDSSAYLKVITGVDIIPETHLILHQLIPNSIYNVADDEGLGDYTITVAESLSGLLAPKCNGECVFPVQYDEADFGLRVQGETEILNPNEVSICSSQKVELTTSTRNYTNGNPLLVYSDWYSGPVYTFDTTTLSDPEIDAADYDRYVNYIGVHERKIFNTDNTIEEDGISGYYSVLNDVKAYRYFYNYAKETGIQGIANDAPTNWPLKGNKAINQTNSKDQPGNDAERFFNNVANPSSDNVFYGITFNDINALHTLLERMDYYIKNDIITLFSQIKVASFSSIAPYFYTILPISPAWEMDGNGNAFPNENNSNRIIPICTSPAQLRVKANAWGPEVEFGEVNIFGLPTKDYRDIKSFPIDYQDIKIDEYVYTVRLPEKFSDGNKPDRCVVPMLYMDEVRLAKVELVKVDNDFIGSSGTPVAPNLAGFKLENIHLGVIDEEDDEQKRNKLDQSHEITVTQEYDTDLNYSVSLSAPTAMKTYWKLLDDRITTINDGMYEGVKLLESYPLIYSSYNYYNPDLKPDDHNLEREGDPYPLDTYTVPFTPDGGETSDVDVVIDKNKIALEIPVSEIPEIFRNKDKTSFKPGVEYLFRFTCTSGEDWSQLGKIDVCARSFYFRLRIVPDTIVWTPPATGDLAGNDSWHNDALWKNNNSGQAPTKGFVPLRATNVILPSNAPVYPVLNNEAIHTWDSDSLEAGQLPDLLPTKYIEYDYNFDPNVARVIHFKNSSELGRQYYLTYDTAKVDLNLETMRWYGLSAPLRDMYSGDYMFERANPLVSMRLFNAKSPQSGLDSLNWTAQFNTTTVRLKAGLGYSVQSGQLYYPNLTDAGIDPYDETVEVEIWSSAPFRFPKYKTKWNFYSEITHAPNGYSQSLSEYPDEDGVKNRKSAHRFVYEVNKIKTIEGKLDTTSIVPSGLALVKVPTKVSTGQRLAVVGNPFMSHLDFAKFYFQNKNLIEPEYHILDNTDKKYNGGDFITLSATDEGADGIISGILVDPITTDPSDAGLTTISIPPMQTFVVRVRNSVSATDSLEITREMSVVDNTHSPLRASSQEINVLRIKAERNTYATHAVFALFEQAHNGYNSSEDTRRILSSQSGGSPGIFTITDGMYLDINRMQEMPESLPIGISTTGKGITRITLSGITSLPGGYNYYFLDNQTAQKVLINNDTYTYEFNNTVGDQIGRFYFMSEAKTPTGINPVQGNIQIYVREGIIHVLSSDGSEIKEVRIYGTDGTALYLQTDTKRSYVEIPVAQTNPVLIVKATAGKTTTTEKVIIKN